MVKQKVIDLHVVDPKVADLQVTHQMGVDLQMGNLEIFDSE